MVAEQTLEMSNGHENIEIARTLNMRRNGAAGALVYRLGEAFLVSSC